MEVDPQLVAQFVECFPKFSGAGIFARPTNPSLLEPIQSRLPASLPPLFEQLLIHYRWSDIYFDNFRFLPNPPGIGFDGFAAELFRDQDLMDVLLPAGF